MSRTIFGSREKLKIRIDCKQLAFNLRLLKWRVQFVRPNEKKDVSNWEPRPRLKPVKKGVCYGLARFVRVEKPWRIVQKQSSSRNNILHVQTEKSKRSDPTCGSYRVGQNKQNFSRLFVPGNSSLYTELTWYFNSLYPPGPAGKLVFSNETVKSQTPVFSCRRTFRIDRANRKINKTVRGYVGRDMGLGFTNLNKYYKGRTFREVMSR